MKPHYKLYSDGRVVRLERGPFQPTFPSALPRLKTQLGVSKDKDVANPELIKAAIRMKGTTLSAIADELGVSRSTVSLVISGRGVSARVSAHISKVTGLPISTLWPPKKSKPVLRRTRGDK